MVFRVQVDLHSFKSPFRSIQSFQSLGPFIGSFWLLNKSVRSFKRLDQLFDLDSCNYEKIYLDSENHGVIDLNS